MRKILPRRRFNCAQCGTENTVHGSRLSAKFCDLLCRRAWFGDVMRHVDRSGSPKACWAWLGCDDGRGKYGRTGIGGPRGAHVAVYERLVRPIPEGKEIDHLCRNPRCVNPAHLEPVTRRENVLRQPKVIAARSATHCCHGHEFTPENTYHHPTQSSRICRACTLAAVRRYQERKSGHGHETRI
jgi:hypothetical protein